MCSSSTVCQIFISPKTDLPLAEETAVYGRVSLISDFKLIRENNNLLSLRHE